MLLFILLEYRIEIFIKALKKMYPIKNSYDTKQITGIAINLLIIILDKRKKAKIIKEIIIGNLVEGANLFFVIINKKTISTKSNK